MNDLSFSTNEEGRLSALARYSILDTAPERAFDDLTDLAARVCGCTMAYVSFIDAGRQWLKSAYGFAAEGMNCDREAAFCSDAIRETDLLIVPDLAKHPRYASYATVTGPPFLRFYAGAPLLTADGFALGTLCVVDTVPRDIDESKRTSLRQIARQVVTELELRRRLIELDETLGQLTNSEAELRAAHERLGLDYRGVLDNMADGVLSVDDDGRIEMANPMAAVILGVPREALVGSRLGEALPGGSDFTAAILAPLSHQGIEAPRVVAFHRGDDTRHISVASTAYCIQFGLERGHTAIIAAFSDVTEMERLRATEIDQNARLRRAYTDMEQSTAKAAVFTKRVQVARTAATGFVLLAFIAVAAYLWFPASALKATASARTPTDASRVTVVTQAVSSRISVVGSIDAGSIVTVVGPFDGSVSEKLFRYGGNVTRDESILVLDSAELLVRLRDARGALIRAKQKTAELRSWTTGIEVSRARRSVNAAELDLGDLRSKARQTKTLLDRGIVAAEEYRGQLQQIRSLELQLETAKQDLTTTIARGSVENVALGSYELANADAKVSELERDLSHTVVRAPVSGVVLQPPEALGGKRAETIEVGSRVSRGQTVVAIGDLETFSVKANVDEIDVSKIRVGQSVKVTGDAFDGMVLDAEVTSVAGQASTDPSQRTGLPAFPITVRIRAITPEQRSHIYVGMSASLSIIAYENAEAIVIPVAALHDDDGVRTVRVDGPAGATSVPVTVGMSTPDGIEIRRGLRAGDVVLVR